MLYYKSIKLEEIIVMKKKKNKGFTLIELLAVIVILAVIALIAVPQVIKILNKSRCISVVTGGSDW